MRVPLSTTVVRMAHTGAHMTAASLVLAAGLACSSTDFELNATHGHIILGGNDLAAPYRLTVVDGIVAVNGLTVSEHDRPAHPNMSPRVMEIATRRTALID